MFNSTKAAMAAVATIAMAFPAQAAFYSYSQTNGDTLTIDTSTGQGTLVGAGRNVTFSSNSLKNFQGGSNPTGSYNISVDSNSRTNSGWVYGSGNYVSGNTWKPVNTGHQQKLIFQNNRKYLLWAIWKPVSGHGHTLGDIYGGYSSTSTSGGSTSTGGSTSSGGTPVPAPGAVLLLGLGVAGLVGRRKLAKRTK